MSEAGSVVPVSSAGEIHIGSSGSLPGKTQSTPAPNDEGQSTSGQPEVDSNPKGKADETFSPNTPDDDGSEEGKGKERNVRDEIMAALEAKAEGGEPRKSEAEEGEGGPSGDQPATGTPKNKTNNPWKLLKEREALVAQKEKEIEKLRGLLGEAKNIEELEKKYAEIQKRADELEQEIRYVDYSKSQEFQDKYEQPYIEKWKQTMSDLEGVTVIDDKTGDERPVEPNDILKLVNLPINKAMEAATEMFGETAPMLMSYRSQLRSLFDAKMKALREARETAVNQAKEKTERLSAQNQQLNELAAKQWHELNNKLQSHSKLGAYFKPVEGQDELNKLLEEGYKFVDETVAQSPFDPKLTESERAEVIKRHVALRARAAGFSRLRNMYEKLMAENAEMKKKLQGYEGSVPTVGGTRAQADNQHGSVRDEIFAALDKLAR